MGLHDCSFDDIRDTFTWNAHRQQLFNSFLIFARAELLPAFPDPLYFDGSFVTDKGRPMTLTSSSTSRARRMHGSGKAYRS